MTARTPASISGWLSAPAVAWVPMVAYFALLPAEPLFNAPLIALAVLGLVLLARTRAAVLGDPRVRELTLLFGCVWLPMVASLPDAAVPIESLRKAASVAVLWPACVYVVVVLGGREGPVLTGVLVIASAWCVDALWQFATGTSLLGHPYDHLRLSGVFYPKLSLGVVLAIVAPLYFEALRRLPRGQPWPALLVLPFALVIALAGSRSSWVVLALGAAGFAVYVLVGTPAAAARRRAAVRLAVVTAALAVAVPLLFPAVAERAGVVVETRIEAASGLLEGDREAVDEALARRLSIWETALDVYREHWLNGVGPRGFRYVYAAHAGPHDYWRNLDPPISPAHPHQVVLEIAAETGTIGLAGYVLALGVLALGALRRLRHGPRRAFPLALAALLVVFPLNVHHSFYGNFSVALAWWLIALALAAAKTDPD